MDAVDAFGLLPTILGCRMFRFIGYPRIMPLTLTLSITNKCNSNCKTCHIWRIYEDNAKLAKDELRVDEYSRIFKSIGRTIKWTTISGGEPYLRSDLGEITESLCKNCKPEIINIPTNGLLTNVIEEKTTEILDKCSNPIFVINLSIDGIGQKHDEIRGVKGNYKKAIDTFSRLKKMKKEYSNLQIGIHTVISKHNIHDLMEIYNHIKDLGPDSYITEIAEYRSEMLNTNEDIPPDPDLYRKAIEDLSTKIRSDYLNSKDFFSRITQALRLTYYQIAVDIVEKKQQVIPCYAGYASCQITPYGDVWPCCVLGYNKPMGNLREVNYNFKEIWFSNEAKAIRDFIKKERCHCPLANANYTNILFNSSKMIQTVRNLWL